MVINKYLAEFMGTFILVFLGSMTILGNDLSGGPLLITVGFGFGLALLAGIWAVGHISGAHFNPAVTLAMLLEKRTSFGDAVGYWVAQFAGAGVASSGGVGGIGSARRCTDHLGLRETLHRDPGRRWHSPPSSSG